MNFVEQSIFLSPTTWGGMFHHECMIDMSWKFDEKADKTALLQSSQWEKSDSLRDVSCSLPLIGRSLFILSTPNVNLTWVWADESGWFSFWRRTLIQIIFIFMICQTGTWHQSHPVPSWEYLYAWIRLFHVVWGDGLLFEGGDKQGPVCNCKNFLTSLKTKTTTPSSWKNVMFFRSLL